MKKTLVFLAIALITCLYANETQNSSDSEIKNDNTEIQSILDSDKKIILNEGEEKSVGQSFLENYLRKNIKNASSIKVDEIYSVKVSTDWRGAIFDVEIKYFNDTKEIRLERLFYNKFVAVNDIYNSKAEPMSKQLNLPLFSKKIAYNNEYLVASSSNYKRIPKSKDMVIFSNVNCPSCKRFIPSTLDYGINNMNIYMFNLYNDGTGSDFVQFFYFWFTILNK